MSKKEGQQEEKQFKVNLKLLNLNLTTNSHNKKGKLSINRI